MKLIENLFGEFIDCILESLPGAEPIVRNEIQYTLIGATQLGSGFSSASFVQVW